MKSSVSWCRQPPEDTASIPKCLASRARKHIELRRQRFDADLGQGRALTDRFLVACASGDLSGLLEMLADDVVVWTDGGGVVRAARRPIYGAEKSARFLVAVATTFPSDADLRDAVINGQPGVLIAEAGVVVAAVALDGDASAPVEKFHSLLSDPRFDRLAH